MSAANQAVFLSYASQDAEAARRVAESLRAAGVEVWFDVEGGLEQGDEWDAKIRQQIKECVLFIAVVSANTEARHEGYFRIEWELAAQRAMGIASGVPFLLPVTIDDTSEQTALVPDRFKAVQWTRLPAGEVSEKVQARFLKLWSHRTGVLKHDAAQVGLDRTAALLPPGSPTSSRARRGRLGWIVGITIGIAVLGALVWTWQYRNADSSRLSGAADQSVSPAAPMSAVPLSEARQLAAKSRALVDELEMGRAELDAADTLCQRAAELDPIEAEVWAAWASVHASFIQSGFDSSPARREAGRNCAAKALQFDARGFEPRLAQAALWVMAEKVARDSPEGRDAEATLRALLRERPDDPRSPFILGHLIRSRQAENDTEWLSLFERAASHPAMTAKTWQSAGYFFSQQPPLGRS